MKKVDVVIIGAGISGAIAARELKREGKSIAVLEARDRVGGRLYTKTIHKDIKVDLGGQWIGPSQENMYELVKEYKSEVIPTYSEGKSIVSLGQKIKTYKGPIPSLPMPDLISLDWAIKKINKLSDTVNLKEPWNTPKAKLLDSITLHAWIKKNIKFAKARKVFQIGAEAVFATSIADISLLHTLIYIKSGNDFDSLVNVENGAQQDRLKDGLQPLVEKIFNELKEDLFLQSPVTSIYQSDENVVVKTDKLTYQAKKVICTIPPATLGNIIFHPELPINKKQFTSRAFMGSAIKCYIIYKNPFWRKQSLNGMAITDSGYISLTFDNYNPKYKQGILLGFVVADKAKEFIRYTKEKQNQIIKDDIVRIFGSEASNPMHIHTEAWSSERWTNGCYSGMFPTNVWSSVGHEWRKPYKHIHWAGTETSEKWQGYMEGAVVSAKRAVKEVKVILQ